MQLSEEPEMYQLVVDEYGPNDSTVVRVMTTQGWFPISAGDYRLVFGVPRRMWQARDTLNEHYYYEMLRKVGEQTLQEIIEAYNKAGAEPVRAFEIEGHFNPDGVFWEEGVKLTLEYPGGASRGTLSLPEWKFRLYRGDSLYRSGGSLLLSL